MISKNLNLIREKIEKTSLNSNRVSDSIRLVAVTKNVEVEKIREASSLGISDIGENRIQEARSKLDDLKSLNLCWHMVGHLQTNKVKYAVDIFEYIHSLDSIKLAEEIDRCSRIKNKYQKVFIEVNTSGEETKFGVSEDNIEAFVNRVVEFKQLDLMGFMTIAPFTDDKDVIRESFRKLRIIRDDMSKKLNRKLHLSMGMSDDFEIAIEEGADFIRLGRVIFGERE
ncbi:MAG: YggS family pyridoxal phosphate-dependent enzyme [Candidatus Kaelpia imicola]|nr:YggS family pyridoxal phosphate-dependent enzyme [Candidatus Kaelpia imicola]